jgi:serine/threonine protein kinase
VVFEATDQVSGQHVALKLMRSDLKRSSLVERFARESALAAKVTHPGVVRTLASGWVSGVPYVVLERLKGQDLSAFLARRGELPLRDALGLAAELCSALGATHAAGVVHRDIKPANIFLDSTSEGQTQLKIVDFGLARDDAAPPLTQTGQLLGSAPYLAPELLDGAERASIESDLYAAACVICELVFGRPPFSGVSRAALRSAIRFDEPRFPLHDDPAVHDRLIPLLRRGLAKAPAERFRSAEQLGAALEALRSGLSDTASVASPPRSSIPERYEVRQRVAEGAHGEVFVVYDRVARSELALKRLRRVSPEAVSRLKHEYRALRDVQSPNLARLVELHVDGDSAFFTMELVRGKRISQCGELDHESLRRLISDIAAGLAALHARGLVHRDVKLDNVLLAQDGRAVLVDYGLAATDGERASPAGTPGYVAKEAFDGVVGPALDCYALGVIGLDLLLGRSRAQALLSRGGQAALRAEPRLAGLPNDLGALCIELVAAQPKARPSAEQVLARLCADAWHGRQVFNAVLPYVGREMELAQLDDALARSADGPVLITVEGAAGLGKTALVEHFSGCSARNKGALVLRSRCHPAESVPLPALDAAIEGLAEELKLCDAAFLSSVAPRGVPALCRLLPPLGQVQWPEWAAEHSTISSDPREHRNQAIEALRELLGRLAARRRVILVLDDAQWIDADSTRLLRALMSGSDAPHMLFVLTRRAEGASDAAEDLLPGVAVERRSLSLGPLSLPEGVELAGWLVALQDSGQTQDLPRLVAACEGNPYFLSLLVARGSTTRGLSIDEALLDLYHHLTPAARSVLEVVSLCRRPLAIRTLLAASSQNDGLPLRELEQRRLVRASVVRGERLVEPYHALVAEVVAGALEPLRKQVVHRELARALAQHEPDDELGLVEHGAASGALADVARLAERASANASDRLAFDTAALLLQAALEHGVMAPVERSALLERLAHALSNAGRAHDAAEALLAASALSERDRVRLTRRAGELFLRSGNLGRGLEVLTAALSSHGLAISEHPFAALAQGLEMLQGLVVRGLDYQARAELECAADALDRVDLCLSLGQGLTYVDLRFLVFLLDGLRLALEAGEPARLQRALALFVAGTASHLPNPLVQPALELCRRLTETSGDAYARVLLLLAEAELAHFEGDFLSAELACERAERVLLDSCPDASRELADVRTRYVLVQYSQKGDYKSIFARSTAWLADAETRQDRFYANWLRAAHALAWVARDRPEWARAELERAEADWPGGSGVFEVAVALYLDVVDRYEGRTAENRMPAQGRKSVLESPASQTPFLAGYLWLHRAWCALRALARGGTERAEVAEAVRQLRALGLSSWRGCADALEANLAFLEGRRESAISLLEAAERTLRQLNLLSLAACARKRRGELAAGSLGTRLVSEGNAQLEELGVVAPDRFAAAYFAPFELSQSPVDAATLVDEA